MMKKNLLICLLCAVVVICACVLPAAADPIKVAINPDAKPFKYLDEDGEFVGIDADVIKAIAEAEGLELEFVEMKFEDILKSVASCEVDAAISALTMTEERAKVVKFTEPYIMGMQSAFVRLKNDGLTDFKDPSIKIYGAKAGTTAGDAGKIIADYLGDELKLYPDYAQLFAALENDEIDAAIADELLAKEFVDSYADIMTIGQPISTEPYAIAVCPENPDLVTLLNHGLNEIRRSGKLDEIVLENLMPED